MKQSSEQVMSEVFAECIDMVMSGAPETACYERYPQYASELEGLLGATARMQSLRAVPPRDAAIIERRRRDFQAAAYALHASHNRRATTAAHLTSGSWLEVLFTRLFGPNLVFSPQKSVVFSIISYLLLIAFTGILTTGAVTASAAALPGDLLYPVKTASEDVQIFFTRDTAARAGLQQTFDGRRLVEAQQVLERRRATILPLQGLIEQMAGATWTVSGLPITLTSDTIIEGQPEVGARIGGRMRAPGDGSLVAQRIEIVEPAPRVVTVETATPAPTATPRPTQAPATATPEPPATQAPAAEVENAPVQLVHYPTVPIVEPVEPTITPTPLPTATPTVTRTPTRKPTATPTPDPTATPISRSQVKGMVSGIVMAIDGNRWLINEVWVETFEGTRYGGSPGAGDHVDVIVEIRPDQAPLALEITKINLPPVVPFFVTGRVLEIGETWVLDVGNGATFSFRVTGETQFPNGPAGLGDTVNVDGQDGPGGRVAFNISKVLHEDTFAEGEITELAGDHWIIGGRWVIITAETKITGNATLGAWARANGYLTDDGSAMIATEIYIE